MLTKIDDYHTVKKDNVTTIAIGDIEGNGEERIIFGGGIDNDKNQLSFIPQINSSPIRLDCDLSKGFIKKSLCFDFNNDGVDEIICCDWNGRVFFLEKNEEKYLEKELVKFSKNANDIKVIKDGTKNYIFTCSSDGNVGIIKFSEGIVEKPQKIPLNYPIWSLLPFMMKGNIFLIICGEGLLTIYRLNIDKDPDEILEFIDYKEIPNFFNKNENSMIHDIIYGISSLKIENDHIVFVCGNKSGKIQLYDFSKEFKELSNFETKNYETYGNSTSIYDISIADIDNCGSNEILVVGKIRKKDVPDEPGFLEIIKLEGEHFNSIYFKPFDREVYSAQVITDPLKKRKYVVASARKISLLIFELFEYQWEEIISELAKQIDKKRGDFCFFIGAGFSIPLFPVAEQISDNIIEEKRFNRQKIMESLIADEKIKNYLHKIDGLIESIPLEALLLYYKEIYGRIEMEELLTRKFCVKDDIEIPNHIQILGYLINKGFIRYVFSVNYDLLVEKTVTDPSFEGLIKREQFISPTICQKKAILKLHGSVSDPDSILAALDEVIDEIDEKKKLAVEFLFNGHSVIFVGYSCKDPDIFPALQEIVEKYQTKCYFVDPSDPNPNIISILKQSGVRDIGSRYFQMKADAFFSLLYGNLNKEKDIGVIEIK